MQADSREGMGSMYYFAAGTECWRFVSCWHEHKTVAEAASCTPCAGGYVVGVENGAMRSLTAEEESEFQSVIRVGSADRPASDITVQPPAEAAVSGSGYAVMTRIRVGDRWTWATWMRFETYTEAAAHARETNKVMRFRSPEWLALRQHSEPASPIVIKTPRESVPPRGEGETLLEFVLRFLSAYGFPQQDEPPSEVRGGLINTDIIDLILSRLSESETRELQRMYAEDEHALLVALGNRLGAVLKPKSGSR
jgi:hypothetical protein